MALNRVANRYAKALAGTWPGKKGTPIREELRQVEKIISQHAELKKVVSSRVFSGETVAQVMADIAEKMKLSKESRQALRLLSEMRRVAALSPIIDRWEEIDLIDSGTVPLIVESSHELEAKERAKVEEKFKGILGKEISAKYELNKKLIGGVRIQAGGRTYDGSLKGWLGSLEGKLVEGRM